MEQQKLKRTKGTGYWVGIRVQQVFRSPRPLKDSVKAESLKNLKTVII